MGFGLAIGFLDLLEDITTNNYSAHANSHTSALHYSTYVAFSACSIFIGCRLATASNAVASSTSVLTSLLAGYCLATHSLLQMTKSHAAFTGISSNQSQRGSYITRDGQHPSGALSDERTGLLFARVTVVSNKSVVSMYNLHFICY
jgi:hypothetical protein